MDRTHASAHDKKKKEKCLRKLFEKLKTDSKRFHFTGLDDVIKTESSHVRGDVHLSMSLIGAQKRS